MDLGSEHKIVEQLHHLAATQRTKMDDRIAERFEDRAAPSYVGVVATDHDQQRAFGCSAPATAHRCIDKSNLEIGGLIGQTPTRLGMDGRVDNYDTAWRHPGKDAIVPHEDILDVGVGHDTQTDHVAGGSKLCGRGYD